MVWIPLKVIRSYRSFTHDGQKKKRKGTIEQKTWNSSKAEKEPIAIKDGLGTCPGVMQTNLLIKFVAFW